MKVAVGGFQRLEIAWPVRGHFGEDGGGGAQTVEIAGCRSLTEAADENRLDRLPNLEDVANEIVVDRAHAGPLVRIGDDKALPLQPPQGLPNRVGAHRITRRKLLGLEPRARRKNAGDNVAAKVAGDAMRKAGILGHLSGRPASKRCNRMVLSSTARNSIDWRQKNM